MLGGFTVREHLAPGFVMGHFALSMIVLIAAVALAWRATYETGSRPRSTDRLVVWSVRALAPLGALAIFGGTAATAAGPHAGGSPGQRIHRLHFKGNQTLTWVVHRHATIAAVFGIAVIAVWLLRRRRGAEADALEPLTVLGVLLAAQGLVGSVQYELRLPTDMVWVHVTLATFTWLAVLWAVAAAGSLVPRRTHGLGARAPPATRGITSDAGALLSSHRPRSLRSRGGCRAPRAPLRRPRRPARGARTRRSAFSSLTTNPICARC